MCAQEAARRTKEKEAARESAVKVAAVAAAVKEEADMCVKRLQQQHVEQVINVNPSSACQRD